MSCMSKNFCLFHVSNLSVRNFRIFLLMYTGSGERSPEGRRRGGPTAPDGRHSSPRHPTRRPAASRRHRNRPASRHHGGIGPGRRTTSRRRRRGSPHPSSSIRRMTGRTRDGAAGGGPPRSATQSSTRLHTVHSAVCTLRKNAEAQLMAQICELSPYFLQYPWVWRT